MASSLCENCNKRPKFGAHKYCGKTCATQAAVKPARSRQSHPQGKPGAGHKKGASAPQKPGQLCIYCGQKPKFNGFDYCGKSCAALASATPPKPLAPQVAPTIKQKTNAPANSAQAPLPKKPRTKASAVPADESTDEMEEPEEEEDSEGSTDLDAYPSDSAAESDQPNVPAVAATRPGTKGASKGGKPGSGAARIAQGICVIPGCGKPVHVNGQGVKTRYCSTKHRERVEAVALGLEAACIMCQRYPQSTSDYFCSSACRNQSMTKT